MLLKHIFKCLWPLKQLWQHMRHAIVLRTCIYVYTHNFCLSQALYGIHC